MYAVGIVLAVYVLRAGDLLTAGPNRDPTLAKPLANLNQLAVGVLVMTCIFAGLLCVHKLRRYIRKSGRRSARSDHQTA